jgi:hypothetical protein
MILKVLLWINISLFILHEMDAVKTREWKMMIFIKRFDDNTGHVIFTALHFFLFIILFYLMDYHFSILFPAVSVLLIIHQIMHIVFRKHSENRMHNIFSQTVIFLMFINSCISLVNYFFILQ